MLLLLFVGALISFPEDLTREMVMFVEGTIMAVIGFYGRIREYAKGGVSIRYSGNALAYLLAFLGGFIEWLGNYDLEGAIGGIFDALSTGNMNLLLPALFTLGNILFRIFQDKPWNDAPQPTPTPA